jgi:hypothetical protein
MNPIDEAESYRNIPARGKNNEMEDVNESKSHSTPTSNLLSPGNQIQCGSKHETTGIRNKKYEKKTKKTKRKAYPPK